MKALMAVLIICLLANCKYANEITLFIKESYCIEQDSYNNMSVYFKHQRDTIYFSYINVIDDGNYINAFSDSNNYAGFFTVGEIIDSSIDLKIRNYRHENSDDYDLTLKFSDGGESLFWEINSEVVAYLPKQAYFKRCDR